MICRFKNINVFCLCVSTQSHSTLCFTFEQELCNFGGINQLDTTTVRVISRSFWFFEMFYYFNNSSSQVFPGV